VLCEWTINKQTLVFYSFFIPTQNTHTLHVSECVNFCVYFKKENCQANLRDEQEEGKLPGKPERRTRRTVKY